MSAVWRVSADEFDVDAYASKHSLNPDVVFRKCEGDASASVRNQSGFNLAVSDSDDAATQVNEALAFLRMHEDAFADLATHGTTSEIDFSLYVASQSSLVTSIHLSRRVLAEFAKLGVNVGVTAYASSEA